MCVAKPTGFPHPTFPPPAAPHPRPCRGRPSHLSLGCFVLYVLPIRGASVAFVGVKWAEVAAKIAICRGRGPQANEPAASTDSRLTPILMVSTSIRCVCVCVQVHVWCMWCSAVWLTFCVKAVALTLTRQSLNSLEHTERLQSTHSSALINDFTCSTTNAVLLTQYADNTQAFLSLTWNCRRLA